MDKQALLDRQKELTEQYNNTESQRNQLNEELLRLQGEYRGNERLITKLDEDHTVVADMAKTIKAKPAKE